MPYLHVCLSKYKIQLKQNTYFQKGLQCFKEVPLMFFQEILLQVEVRMDWALAEVLNNLNCSLLLKQTSKAFTMCIPSGGYRALGSQVFVRCFFHNTPEKLCAAGLVHDTLCQTSCLQECKPCYSCHADAKLTLLSMDMPASHSLFVMPPNSSAV